MEKDQPMPLGVQALWNAASCEYDAARLRRDAEHNRRCARLSGFFTRKLLEWTARAQEKRAARRDREAFLWRQVLRAAA